ncbi:MAG: helix-turn-helix domain-containing protein [Actinobacteria bacterium]|nr:helix-turn-helix domain-containing protein [Actinomycetota bacterium]
MSTVAPDRLLDVEEAAELIGVPVSWIQRACRADEIPHVRVGRYIRFRRESLEAWVAQKERGG